MDAKKTPYNPADNTKGTIRPHVKKQQQQKKDKLASALRDNLRRRKIASLDSGQGEGE